MISNNNNVFMGGNKVGYLFSVSVCNESGQTQVDRYRKGAATQGRAPVTTETRCLSPNPDPRSRRD